MKKSTGKITEPAPDSPYGLKKLEIYRWQYPAPTDFLTLSESRLQWKIKTDTEEAASDLDEGLEDWDLLDADSAEVYPSLSDFKYSIARTFAIRAKRAFRAEKSWKTFADEEMQAVCEIHELRLAIFDDISPRLCNEIWLEAYPRAPEVQESKRDSKIDAEEARQALQAVKAGIKEQKHVAGPTKQVLETVNAGIKDQEAVAKQARRAAAVSTTSSTPTPDGGWVNNLGNKRGKPRAEKTTQAMRMSPALPAPRSDEGGRIGNVGVHGSMGMTAVEEMAMRDLDFETSEEEEG